MKTDVSVPAGTVVVLKFVEPVTSGATGAGDSGASNNSGG
jgi:hypothetical protein